MSLKLEIKEAVNVLEQLQTALAKCDDPRTRVKCHDDLQAIMIMLKNPMLNKIVAIQDALQCLKAKVAHHPSLLPEDFEISADGELILTNADADDSFIPIQEPVVASTKTSIDSQSHFSIGNEDELSSSNSADNRRLESMRTASVSSLHKQQTEDTPKDFLISSNELKSLVERSADQKEVHHVRLSKPEGTNLGFSVVGLKSEQRGDLGIYIKDIQQSGVAGQDGRLQDGDQILAIDGKIIDAYISHQKAISILQNASNVIDLYVARDNSAQTENEINSKNVENQQSKLHPFSNTHIVPPSHASHTSNMLNTEWAQVEVIYLVNDGSGLGFGIIGGRSTGVVVKTILPRGVADVDGRLASGDHILQIGDVNLRGLGSDQVASVLRKAGNHVRLVVARPVESASPEFQVDRSAPIVETRVLNDPEELERHLMSCGDPTSLAFLGSMLPSTSASASLSNGHHDIGYINGDNEILTVAANSITKEPLRSQSRTSSNSVQAVRQSSQEVADDEEQKLIAIVQGGEELSLSDLPEMENIQVSITKDYQGLGITIAGYVCEREELSGIFVKSVNAGSAADRSKQIQVNDQIIEVDGHSLSGMSNHAAVEVLKATSKEVELKLVRYLRGPKFEQLQQAIANSELKTTPSTPNPARSSVGELPNCDALRTALIRLEDEDESSSQDRSEKLSDAVASDQMTISPPAKYSTTSPIEDIELLIDDDYCGHLKHSVETAIQRKWAHILGDETDIVVAQLTKFEKGGGLGISLEGTVDVEDGKEVRPHHYIRSILPEGPVGKEASLKSGDELLEVNNRRLYGLNHLEVVATLKELPQSVRLVCGRRKSASSLHPIDAPTADRDTFAARNILGGSLQNLLPANDRLVKAKSDGSLASSAAATSDSNSFTKVKSRSLEPLSGLAMWSTEFQEIELVKGERGLGFSILDYQDPINPHDTVIVIRSLVPGGVAEKDGRLIPGDRLIAVNGISLENAALDTAVAALKGAPKGLVEIVVAKPVSVLESPGQLDLIIGSQRSDIDSEYTDDSDFPNSDSNELSRDTIEGSTVRRQSTNISSDSPDITQSKAPLPLSRTSLTRETSLTNSVATERLIGGSNEASFDIRKDKDSSQIRSLQLQKSVSDSCSEDDLDIQNEAGYHTNTRISSNSHLSFQKTIVIEKAEDHIGISFEFDNEMNGIIVNSIREDGAIYKDGRLCKGDLIVAVSDICLGKRSDSEIKSILKNSQLDRKLSITFVPVGDVTRYKELVRLENIKRALEKEDTLINLRDTDASDECNVRERSSETLYQSTLAKKTPVTDDSEEDPFTITFRNLPEAGREMCLSEKALCDELRRNGASEENVEGRPSDVISSFEGKHWGPERRVDVNRDDKGSLGISIVGGKVDLAWNETSVTGIFIKNVLPNSPAGKSALLKTGDRILEVEGTDLRSASHEKAVEVIKKTGNPVCFVVQSLIQWAPVNSLSASMDSSSLTPQQIEAVTTASSSELIQNEGLIDMPVTEEALQNSKRVQESESKLGKHDHDLITFNQDPALIPFQQMIQDIPDDCYTNHYCTIYPRIDDCRIRVASAFTITPASDSQLSRVRSFDESLFLRDDFTREPRGTDDPEALVDPYYYYAKSALDQWHDRSFKNKKKRRRRKTICSSGSSSSSEIQSPCMSKLAAPPRNVGRRSSGSEAASPEDGAVESNCEEGPCISDRLTHSDKITSLKDLPIIPLSPPINFDNPYDNSFKCDEIYGEDTILDTINFRSWQQGQNRQGNEQRSRNHDRNVFFSKGSQDRSFFEERRHDTLLEEFRSSRPHKRKKYPTDPFETGSTDEINNGDKSKIDNAKSFAEEDPEEEYDDNIGIGGRTTTLTGQKIDRSSAGALKLTKAENAGETEDQFGYTKKKIQKKYARLEGEVVLIDLFKEENGVGITLSGHKDRSQMAAFVCGINPSGSAFKDGRLKVGDEILEVNGHALQGISHLNASKIFRQLPGPAIKIIIRRTAKCLEEMAVKPITQFPVTLEDESPEEKYAHFNGLAKFVLNKSQSGLGIMIIEGKHADYGQGIFISDLQEGSIAAEAGLLVGDMILCVNKEYMVGINYEEATNIVKRLEGIITMWVANTLRAKPALTTEESRHQSGTTDGVRKHSNITDDCKTQCKTTEAKKPEDQNTELPADPHTADIIPSKETVIEIIKEKMGLGLSIVGGSDTLLGAIIIHEVYPDGAASKDGRLKPGDQILEVNNENFRVITHQKALNVLRQTPSKVKMVVYREESAKEENLYDIIDVQLTKKAGKGLGLSIVGRKTGKGVFISDLVPSGVAESDGRLMQGDQILEVNDNNLRGATQEQAAAILKCAPGYVSMKIGRLKPGKNVSIHAANATWPVTISDDSPRNSVNITDSNFTKVAPQQPSLAIGQFPLVDGSAPIRRLLLNRGEEGLGFSIVGGYGSNMGDLPIYVKSVFEKGAASKEGSLRRGDQILEVNGCSLNGLSHGQAVAILKESRGTVTLTVLPSK